MSQASSSTALLVKAHETSQNFSALELSYSFRQEPRAAVFLHPIHPDPPSTSARLPLLCWTGTAVSTGRPQFLNLAWLRSPGWGQKSHQYFPVLCQQWKSSNKTSKPLLKNHWGQHLTSSFSEWDNKLGSTVSFLLLLLFFLKFQIKWHFHNEFSSLELKAYSNWKITENMGLTFLAVKSPGHCCTSIVVKVLEQASRLHHAKLKQGWAEGS